MVSESSQQAFSCYRDEMFAVLKANDPDSVSVVQRLRGLAGLWLVAKWSLSWVCWDVGLGTWILWFFCCLSSRNRISSELLIVGGRNHTVGSPVFMKMSCEFHLRKAFQLIAASFNAVWKQYWLNLLLYWIFWWWCGLCLLWLVWKTAFFCVNDISVCSPVAWWSWICNTGNGGSWPPRICAITSSKLQYLCLLD